MTHHKQEKQDGLRRRDYRNGKRRVTPAFAHLSQAQAQGLVYWSAGIALTESSGISQIRALLAQVLEEKGMTVGERLRDW